MSVHGWSAPEVGTAFERAEHIARELERSIDLAPPLAGLWLFHTARGQFSRAEEITKELFSVAHTLNDQDILLQAHHCVWPIRWFRGALIDAKAHVDAGLGLYDEFRHAKHRFLFIGHDPAICALSIRSVLQSVLGYPMQAVESERDAINLAQRLQHAPSLAQTLWHVCTAQVARGDAAAVIKIASELLMLSEENGLPQPHAIGLTYLGWALAQKEDTSMGVRYVEEGLAAWNRLGARSHLCFAFCLLAETYFAGRQYDKGMEYANSAIALSSEIGDRWCLPRIHMIEAQLLQQARADGGAVEQSLRTAIEVAQSQRAKGWELRATSLLARLWRDQGKREEARELLAPVYGWFTEGFDTRDLKEARALLDELAA
jgi:predicted ATPase